MSGIQHGSVPSNAISGTLRSRPPGRTSRTISAWISFCTFCAELLGVVAVGGDHAGLRHVDRCILALSSIGVAAAAAALPPAGFVRHDHLAAVRDDRHLAGPHPTMPPVAKCGAPANTSGETLPAADTSADVATLMPGATEQAAENAAAASRIEQRLQAIWIRLSRMRFSMLLKASPASTPLRKSLTRPLIADCAMPAICWLNCLHRLAYLPAATGCRRPWQS